MYIPREFQVDDERAALALIRAEPFAMLATTVDGELNISHIPLSIECVTPQLVLAGHVAKANPHWRLLEGQRVVAVFRGPHAYISPRWYASPSRSVPTWNYSVVHCSGVAELASESDLATILARLVQEMEGSDEGAWSIETADVDYRERLMRGIVAFHITVDSIQTKFKLSQNRSEADRISVIAALKERDRPGDREVADAIHETSRPS